MSKVEDQGETLYERCLTSALSSPEGKAKLFYQDEMLTFGVASTPGDLMAICQGLMNAQLMRLMSMEGKTCWALRTKDVANK